LSSAALSVCASTDPGGGAARMRDASWSELRKSSSVALSVCANTDPGGGASGTGGPSRGAGATSVPPGGGGMKGVIVAKENLGCPAGGWPGDTPNVSTPCENDGESATGIPGRTRGD
jgi:hypothetical protein